MENIKKLIPLLLAISLNASHAFQSEIFSNYGVFHIQKGELKKKIDFFQHDQEHMLKTFFGGRFMSLSIVVKLWLLSESICKLDFIYILLHTCFLSEFK